MNNCNTILTNNIAKKKRHAEFSLVLRHQLTGDDQTIIVPGAPHAAAGIPFAASAFFLLC